jgi:formylglycine-generating enzyme required for sulfatase activity/energy-coupling factor transporter ATP-binding protein EcfA2
MNSAPEYDVFLSYNTRDGNAAERVAHALKDRGLTVFLAHRKLVPGRPWPDALEEHLGRCRSVAVVLGPSGMGQWQQREQQLALDRQTRDPGFRVIPVILPDAEPPLGFLSLNTWVDLRGEGDDRDSMDLLAAAVRGQSPDEVSKRTREAAARICPYRGLEVFREEDAPFFFGREAFTRDLRVAVAEQPFVAVVGPSGSGKSSVVRAGLIPDLRRGVEDGAWEIVTLVPGRQPLHALSGALLPLLEPKGDEVERLVRLNELAGHLADGKVQLHQVIERALMKQPGTDRLLLLVDQWEELYTHKTHGDQSELEHKHHLNRFIEELLTAVHTAPVTVILTLRADFYGDALRHRALADALPKAQVNLGPMTREELERAVTKPAERTGLSFDTGLAERLLDDVGDEPGNLPLLEFALKALWKGRRGDRLLYEVYSKMGGVKGAIARHAEAIYKGLNPAQQKAAERVFTRLVRPGDETGDTRRRAGLQEFDDVGRTLVSDLARPDARLLVTGRDTVTEEETVEVAHEALIRQWDRLRGWVDKVRKQLNDQRLLEDVAKDWRKRGKPKFGGLASAGQFWKFRRAGPLSHVAREYLEASRQFLFLQFGTIVVSLGLAVKFLMWSDDLGLSAEKGLELLAYRVRVYQPDWIPEMVTIAPGSFRMGSPVPDDPYVDVDAEPSEFPAHKVTIAKGFRIGSYEVTFEQYCASTRRPCPSPEGWGYGNQPVINVSWHDARGYAAWLSWITGEHYRLPTEAEWEYTARAGTMGRYWWCTREEPDCDVDGMANCHDCGSEWGGRQPAPVGSFAANPFGVYDTAGNLLEWVQDCWHDSYECKERPDDGTAWEGPGDCRQRVVRGGNWFYRAVISRSAYRFAYGPDEADAHIGFRLAQDTD